MIYQKMRLNFFCFLLLFILLSCGKDKVELNWTQRDINTDHTLTNIHFTDDQKGHIVGGHTWFEGVYLFTEDGGENWTIDTFTNKQMFGLHFNENGRGYTVGIEGLIYRLDTMNQEWQNWNFPRYDFFRDIAYFDNLSGLAVGGIAYRNGVIIRMDENFQMMQLDTFEQEITTITYSEKNIAHAAGYGIVLRSTDGGYNWVTNEVAGDFYKSIHFPSASIGYAVGFSGTIIKTEDKGATWRKLQNGNVTNTPFRNVFFRDEQNGYVVGDKGTFWRTRNGGDDWEIIEGLPALDYYDVFVQNGQGYIVGSEGVVIHFID